MPSFRNSRLLALHQEAGARFVDSHSWDLLANYGDPVAEHHAIRTTVGLAEPAFVAITTVTGRGAADFLARELSGMPEGELADGHGAHAYVTNGLGGILGDPAVYRCGSEYVLLSWADKAHTLFDVLHHKALGSRVIVTDKSRTLQLLSLEGPRAEEVITGLVDGEDAEAIREMDRVRVRRVRLAGVPVLLTRFSFSGEDGFHIILPRDEAPEIWTRLLDATREHEGLPVGADAIESTRVEAGLPSYGREYSSTIVLSDLVRLDDSGPAPTKKLVGLRAKAGIAGPLKTGQVMRGETILGETTSIIHSPTFGQAIAIARLDAGAGSAHAGDEVEVEVEIDGRTHPFIVMDLPFYSR